MYQKAVKGNLGILGPDPIFIPFKEGDHAKAKSYRVNPGCPLPPRKGLGDVRAIEKADVYVVAAGIAYGYTVVCNESRPTHRQKMPAACKYYNVDCHDLAEFLRDIQVI